MYRASCMHTQYTHSFHFNPYTQCVLPHVIFISFKIILYEHRATISQSQNDMSNTYTKTHALKRGKKNTEKNSKWKKKVSKTYPKQTKPEPEKKPQKKMENILNATEVEKCAQSNFHEKQ